MFSLGNNNTPSETCQAALASSSYFSEIKLQHHAGFEDTISSYSKRLYQHNKLRQSRKYFLLMSVCLYFTQYLCCMILNIVTFLMPVSIVYMTDVNYDCRGVNSE